MHKFRTFAIEYFSIVIVIEAQLGPTSSTPCYSGHHSTWPNVSVMELAK